MYSSVRKYNLKIERQLTTTIQSIATVSICNRLLVNCVQNIEHYRRAVTTNPPYKYFYDYDTDFPCTIPRTPNIIGCHPNLYFLCAILLHSQSYGVIIPHLSKNRNLDIEQKNFGNCKHFGVPIELMYTFFFYIVKNAEIFNFKTKIFIRTQFVANIEKTDERFALGRFRQISCASCIQH